MQLSQSFSKASSLILLICTIQTLAQTVPQCWQDCTKTTIPACSVTDLTCICSSLPNLSKLNPFIACIAKSCDSSSPAQALSVIAARCEISKFPIAPSVISQAIKAVPTSGFTGQTLLFASPTTISIIITTQPSSTVVPVATSAAAATTKKGNGDGTVLNLEGGGIKRERGCLLGLTVGILAGIAWF